MQTTLWQLAHRFAGGNPWEDPHDAYIEALTEMFDELCENGYIEYRAIVHGDMMRAEVVGVPSKDATIEQMEETEIEILPAKIYT